MPRHPKLLYTAAFFASLIAACSSENAPEVSAPVTPTAEAVATPNLDAEKAAMAAKELAAKKLAIAEAEAAAAQAKADAEKLATLKQEQARAEADALAAKKEAEAKAAKEAAARAEQEKQLALERQAALNEQLAANAQAAANAKAAAEAQAQREAQAALQAQEAQALREAQAARQAKEAQAIRDAQAAQLAAQQTAQITPAPTVTSVATPAPQTPVASAGPNASYNAFLSKYVSNTNGINLVAYDKITPQDRASLQAYIQTLSAMNIEALPRDAEMATWFNLYNAKTIELILENYPLKSIRKISSPWGKNRLVVNGKKMSLDDIEHGTVRRKYDEPRVHYAFNCASIGCPNIKRTAWEAATLEADLAQASRDFIASERGLSVQNGKIVASSIFKWYKKDFGGNEAGILAHMRQYASGSKKAALDAANKIDKYDYDWDLNIR